MVVLELRVSLHRDPKRSSLRLRRWNSRPSPRSSLVPSRTRHRDSHSDVERAR